MTPKEDEMTDKPTIRAIVESLGGALAELVEVQETFERLKSAESEARREATIAVNNLNKKQKEVDAILKDLMAASDGDWGYPSRSVRIRVMPEVDV